MALDIRKKESDSESDGLFLGFRETVMMTVGFMQEPVTKSQLFDTYKRVHRQLTRLGVVIFPLPKENVFLAMLRKLKNKSLISEVYMKHNYGVELSVQGQAAFDVILANLQINPLFSRITNVFEFYSQSIPNS